MPIRKLTIDSTADYLTSKEAIAALAIKAETFYTYVGRGWIRRIPHLDGKHSLYSREDIERIRARSTARSGHSAVAAAAMHWGAPVIETAITELTSAGPKYRGRQAVDLAVSGCPFESVAELLWRGEWTGEPIRWPTVPLPFSPDKIVHAIEGLDPGQQIMEVLSLVTLQFCILTKKDKHLARPVAGQGRMDGANFGLARRIIAAYAGCLGYLSPKGSFVAGEPGESLAGHIARATSSEWTQPALGAVNAALIVVADHELGTSTFTARLAASTGADYFYCLGAALYTHTGGNIRAHCDDIEDMVHECHDRAAFRKRMEALQQTARRMPGFNHPFYPKGDPRALYLLDMARKLGEGNRRLELIFEFVNEAATGLRAYPSIAIGLVAISCAIGLPKRSAGVLWVIGWTAGWSAHIFEQSMASHMMRPRAKYIKHSPLFLDDQPSFGT